MKPNKTIYAADLFCGAGGTSAGLLQAAEILGLDINLVAINHWDVAIATHTLNHPGVSHVNSDLEKVDPLAVVPGGKLRLLVASPECTHFSKARGGKPLSKQSRASVKYILRWVGALDIQDVLIENVKEFMDWGPLHRKHSGKCDGNHDIENPNENQKKIIAACQFEKAIQKRKGEYFQRFIRRLEAHGYVVRHRVLCAADYGDPTTRKRLFIRARKGSIPIFPEPSHGKNPNDLFGSRLAWRSARDIIDWTIKGVSIFSRKKPLSPNTLRRIRAGLIKFGGKSFVIGQQSKAAPRDIDQPVPTVAGAGAISFVEPFIIGAGGPSGQGNPQSISDPLGTITGDNHRALIESFIIPFFGERDGQAPRTHSIDEPLQTITGQGAGGLVEPFVVMLNGTSGEALDSSHRSVEDPLPTVTASGHLGIVEPFIVALEHTGANGSQVRSVEDPISTITARGQYGLVEPFIMPVNHGKDDNRAYSLDRPMPTVTSVDAWSIVEPYLVEYHGTATANSIDDPLKTQTGRDRFGLVEPMAFEQGGKSYILDIRFRMLQPHELAGAMSFPKHYKFHGTREQVVKQIGNAVPVQLSEALCRSSFAE